MLFRIEKLALLRTTLRDPIHQLYIVHMRIYTLVVCCLGDGGIKHRQSLVFSASWRIVLEGRIAGSALPQTKHILMQLACVAATTDRGVLLHCKAWAIHAHYWLEMYAVCAEGYAL